MDHLYGAGTLSAISEAAGTTDVESVETSTGTRVYVRWPYSDSVIKFDCYGAVVRFVDLSLNVDGLYEVVIPRVAEILCARGVNVVEAFPPRRQRDEFTKVGNWDVVDRTVLGTHVEWDITNVDAAPY